MSAFLLSALATAVASFLLAALARWAAWGDRGDLERKHQLRPVPPVGGTALWAGFAVALWLEGGWTLGSGPWGAPSPRLALAALGLAWVVGLWDDLKPGGLAPLEKLFGQAIAALPLGLAALTQATDPRAGCMAALLWGLGALVAMNALNTFDNADGALGLLGFLGLALAGSPACGALLGFLPANMNASRREGSRATPTAYLGDSGSHWIGMMVLLTPAAWPVLVLPLVDLVRLSVVRWRRGGRPWIGDRLHLAHRLQRAGLTTPWVCLSLALLALPPLLLGARAGAPGALVGALLTAGGLRLALLCTPEGEAASPSSLSGR